MNRLEAIAQRRAVLVAQAQKLRAQVQDSRRTLGSQLGSSLLLAGATRVLAGSSRWGRWAGLAVAVLPVATALLSRFRRKSDPAPARSGR